MADEGSRLGKSAGSGHRSDSVTHSNVAVRLDLIDPEAFLDQGARSAQQLFELPEGERPHLRIHST